MRLRHVDDEPTIPSAPAEPEDPAQNVPVGQQPIERRRSRWLVLAFVALLSTLVLLATTDVGAAASSLLGASPYDCGGP